MTSTQIDELYSAYLNNPSENETAFFQAIRDVGVQQSYLFSWNEHVTDREAIGQDIALAVFKALPTLELRGTFSLWLNGVIRHTTIDHVRAKDRRQKLHDIDIPESFDEVNPEHWERLKEAAGPNNRTLIALLVLGYSFEEAGEQLGITGAAVRNRIQRIKQRVQKGGVTK